MTHSQAEGDVGRLDRLDRLVAAYPHLPFIAPFMTFLILMALGNLLGRDYFPIAYAARIVGSLAVYLMFMRFYPPLGKAHWPLAVGVGLATAFMWVSVHHLAAAQPWYRYTQIFGSVPTEAEFYIPWDHLGYGWALWAFLIVRIGGAATVVPMVEEIFWRAFMLRFLIDRHRFEEIPLGTFTWPSFLICSLLSAAQHPHWEVGILCWMIYNALFCWKKSLLCLMITHGVTNLALYTYVVMCEDWVFW